MNKRAVAEALTCSTRQVEKYVSQKRLNVKEYIHGKTGREGVYDPAEVERLKAELVDERETVIGKPPALIQQRDASPLAAGATNDERLSMMAARMAQEMMKHMPALLPPAPNGDAAPASVAVPVADKLTLSLVEAAQLSGLSRGHLREAIEMKKLKARIIGRGWRVKRDDLDLYVKKL